MQIAILVILVIIALILISSIKVVTTGHVFVVERFGRYNRTLEPGWHVVLPVIDFVRAKVSTKQQILEIEPQSVITKDNVKISIDNIVFYQVINPRDAVYNIENYRVGIMMTSAINMRNIVGNLTLDEVLSGRDQINLELLSVVENITDKYGVKILSVEIKNIIPPAEIQQAMETQMKAEREKRATILQAEGLKQSEIAKAEGEKQAKILQAEAEKEANIKRAEGLKESQLLEAEGKAKAIEAVADAQANAITVVNQAIINSGTNETVIALKQIEALAEMAKNPANKLIIPSEAMSSLGNISAIAETIKLSK